MRHAALIGAFLLVAMTGTARAEPGFDEKYQRDFNIFNPINQYQPGNPLNPINAYDPANPFNPSTGSIPATRQSDQPIQSQQSFNPVNRYRPENPLNRSMSSIPPYRLRRWMVGRMGRGGEATHAFPHSSERRFTSDEQRSQSPRHPPVAVAGKNASE